MRYNTTLGYDNITKKFAQFFVVSKGKVMNEEVLRRKTVGHIPDGELQMPGYDTVLLVVPCCITGEFENLSSEVFEDGSKVDCVPSSQTKVTHDG